MKLKRCWVVPLSVVLSIPILLTAGSLIPRSWRTSAQTGCRYKVCVTRTDIHTNLVVPVQNEAVNWRNYLPEPLTRSQYIGFGWGERDWYMNPPTRLEEIVPRGFQALFLPNDAAMRVQAHDRLPDHDEVKCIGVERSQYLALVQFIKQSFQRTEQGKLIQLSDPATGTAFYEATGSYSILRNSNHWTADGLDVAGINTPLWAGFSPAVMHHVQATC
ncbi:hypothetical protein LEP3755_21610 [Leptolyngbya sp. NIES-3755]|nr:hypothetical protein LEP3755_21610 [Leptolyngbya sp. NIES-3755]